MNPTMSVGNSIWKSISKCFIKILYMFKHSLGKQLTKFKPASETGFGTESEQRLAGNFNPSSTLSGFSGSLTHFLSFWGKFDPFLLHSVNNSNSDSDFSGGKINPSLSLLSSLVCLFCTFFISLSVVIYTLSLVLAFFSLKKQKNQYLIQLEQVSEGARIPWAGAIFNA